MWGAFPLLISARSEACVQTAQGCLVGEVCEPVASTCSSSATPWGMVIVAAILLAAPIVVAVHLWRAAGRATAASAAAT